MGTSSGRVNQDVWDKLLEAYRGDPGNHSAASRHAMVQRKTAKRAWDKGYPDRPWGSKPIRQLISEDVELARSRHHLEEERASLMEDIQLTEAERDREVVRQAALNARKEEAALIVLSRQAAIRAMAAATGATEGLKDSMKRIGKELTAMSSGGPLTAKELNQMSAIGRRFSSMLREIAAAGQMAMEMERLYHGDPTTIIGIETELDGMPLGELVKMAGYQDEVLQRAAARGLIVLDGGLKKTQDP
jgi:hypothetical protein